MSNDTPLIYVSAEAEKRCRQEGAGTLFDGVYEFRGSILVDGLIVIISREEYERLQPSANQKDGNEV